MGMLIDKKYPARPQHTTPATHNTRNTQHRNTQHRKASKQPLLLFLELFLVLLYLLYLTLILIFDEYICHLPPPVDILYRKYTVMYSPQSSCTSMPCSEVYLLIVVSGVALRRNVSFGSPGFPASLSPSLTTWRVYTNRGSQCA